MQMVHVGHMGMRMPQGLMAMQVTMPPLWHYCVCMPMVPIVMRMGMFVFKCFMVMVMAVRLKQVQHYASQHQHTTDNQHPGALPTSPYKCT